MQQLSTMRVRQVCLIFASAFNIGADNTVAFPIDFQGIFCIGSADGLGTQSIFSPLSRSIEKYSVLGEAVSGACPKFLSEQHGYNGATQTIRRNGTSTAVLVASGIAALLVDYVWQFMDGKGAWDYESVP